MIWLFSRRLYSGECTKYLVWINFQGRNLSKNFGGKLENDFINTFCLIWPLLWYLRSTCFHPWHNKDISKLTDLYKIQPWAFAKHSLEKYFAAKMPRSNWKGILVVHCIQAEKKLSMYLNEKLLSIYNRESLIPYLLISGPLSNNTRISNNACTWHTLILVKVNNF